jgi:hypothetical protein
MKLFIIACILVLNTACLEAQTYRIVDTKQTQFYDTTVQIGSIAPGAAFYGQDASYSGNQPSYTDNGDGTITDNITGLMWQKTPDRDGDGDIDYDDKLSYQEALDSVANCNTGGYNDWRVPTIKEQYSLIIFTGIDPSDYTGTETSGLTPFIDTNYFAFDYGDQNAGERIIDAQFATSTLYVSTTMNGNQTMFGVNFADGRIKGYPTEPMPGQTVGKQFYVLYVRGNANYGINNFYDNGDGTITDNATGLMWMQNDNGGAVSWKDALSYAENFSYAGHSDWRLPNAKELQSILDYTRSPATTSSAAIDSIFNCSTITNEGGSTDYPFFWSSTTHVNGSLQPGSHAAYVSFGKALGWMEQPPASGNYTLFDVHGAGSQRSDPKSGNPADYPYGFGPQGDVIRIFNYVRLVRDADNVGLEDKSQLKLNIYPNPASNQVVIQIPEKCSHADAIVNIISVSGQIVIQQEANANESITLDITNIPNGIYSVSVKTSDTVYSSMFVKL